VQVWWVQGLIKPSAAPGAVVPTNVGWHQDRQYWKLWTKESELFTAWVALSDVPAASGPMIFARGSHQWGLLDQGDFFGQDQSSIRNGITVPTGRTWEEVQAILPLGGVSFHHNLTFHGSGPNTSGKPRMSVALHMRTDKSAAEPGEKDPWLMKWVNDESVCPVWRR
jgi:ectoine hydroxylase-related dioxygenase (phytanoyl-CoA dioxygenase family)